MPMPWYDMAVGRRLSWLRGRRPAFAIASSRPGVSRAIVAVLMVVSFLACAPAMAQNTPGVLKVSAIPDESPTELQRKFKPLGEYLAKATGLKVEFTPVTDYAASVEGLINHKLDMVWFGSDESDSTYEL